MLLGWLSNGIAMPVADAYGPFIISEITNKLIFGLTIVSLSFQDFAYCGTRELIFSNLPKSFFFYAVLSIDMCKLLGKGMG
ncbi:hypothetical protein CASFOL_022448 [Castilleja foliolosa]|uniref:Uncharacterized protein n=1 Tax=Castilleja foliolosa TaxID=1961234 RepID=A0ABD3CXY2_9LAMI